MAILLALTLGTSLPVDAETVQNQKLIKGDWTLEEQLKMEDSKITADKFSLDGSKIPDSKSPVENSPVESIQSSLEGKNGIEISNLIVQAPTGEGLHASIDNAVELQGSSWAAPVISISGVTSDKDNPATSLNGLYTMAVKDDVHHKYVQNHLKTDWLRVNGVSTDTAQQVYGAFIGAADLSPYTEGAFL